MNLNLLFKLTLVLLGFAYIGLQAFQEEIAASGVCALMLFLLTILYRRLSRINERLFHFFLIFFTVAEIIGFIYWFVPTNTIIGTEFLYYLANSAYIVSYAFLIYHVVNGMAFKKVLKRFVGPAVILLVLDVFCVYIVTETASAELNLSEFFVELTYNGVIMILLSVALLNFLNRDSNKSMLFLIGSIFIVFSEIIQLAYFYIVESNDLSATYATFLVMAFFFLYLQSQLEASKEISEIPEETFKVS